MPCRSEFPVLRDALAAHAADGLVLLGVLFKDQPDPARTFVSSFGASWPSVVDPVGDLARAYRVVAPPQTYFIDASGVLRAIQIGEMSAADFETDYAKIAP